MTYNYKPKHTLPKLGEYVLNQDYAITLNPSRQYKLNRLSNQEKLLKKILGNKESQKSFIMKLFPELSPISRFHWHGIINLKNIFIFVRDVIPGLISDYTIVIKEITSRDDWDKYIRKQQSFFKNNYINNFPIILKPNTKPETKSGQGFFPTPS